ncbi:MAG: hypothetical protein DMF88_25615, partial [Acidobacteria bacterium]
MESSRARRIAAGKREARSLAVCSKPVSDRSRYTSLHCRCRRRDGVALSRGSIVTVQSDLFNADHASVTVCPITSDCVDAPLFRVNVAPGARTGLTVISQVMVDKVVSLPRAALAREIGRALLLPFTYGMDSTVAGLRDARLSGVARHHRDHPRRR